MFGHDDNNTPVANQDDANPAHDGVLGGAAAGAPEPAGDNNASPAFIQSSAPTPAAEEAESKLGTPLPTPAIDPENDDLIGIKQSALRMLTPLVGHLDQTPEEKFRTTMMMIQASDDQALVKDAYAAAQAISDEKTKAQALLDIINEINYFTQHN